MRAKPLSTNYVTCKMLDRHNSKFMVRQVKSLRMREFSQTIFNFTHDNSCYMKTYIKYILQEKPYNSKGYPTPILTACQPEASLRLRSSSQQSHPRACWLLLLCRLSRIHHLPRPSWPGGKGTSRSQGLSLLIVSYWQE
jgi:hypothetical protein